MKTIKVVAPLAVALALSLAACGKSGTTENVAVSNEVLIDEGGADANLSDNGLGAATGDLGNASLDNAALDNAAVGNDAATANGL